MVRSYHLLKVLIMVIHMNIFIGEIMNKPYIENGVRARYITHAVRSRIIKCLLDVGLNAF